MSVIRLFMYDFRGHTVKAVCESFQLAKDAGFKVVAHMMPDLPNMTLQRDIQQFVVSEMIPIIIMMMKFYENVGYMSGGGGVGWGARVAVVICVPLSDTVTSISANGSTAFIWKLCCHWPKGLWQCKFIVAIQKMKHLSICHQFIIIVQAHGPHCAEN